MKSNFPALTSLRGIAAWWVVFFHFREQIITLNSQWLKLILDHGYLAVDLFFIMSGFVIALHYTSRFRSLSKPAIMEFLALRLARIYPLHFVILVCYLFNPLSIYLASKSGTVGERYEMGYFLQSLFLIQNWGFNSGLSWNIPAWSISAEWGAYLVFPVLAWCVTRISKLAVAGSFACLALISANIIGYLMGSLGNEIVHFGLLRCLFEFSLGSLLHRIYALAGPAYRSPPLTFLAGLALLTVGILADWPDFQFALASMVLIIIGLLNTESLTSRTLSNPAFLYIGEVSYSTYMVHYFIKDWTKFLLVGGRLSSTYIFIIYIILTALASVILYNTVEMPGRRFLRKYITTWRRQRSEV